MTDENEFDLFGGDNALDCALGLIILGLDEEEDGPESSADDLPDDDTDSEMDDLDDDLGESFD